MSGIRTLLLAHQQASITSIRTSHRALESLRTSSSPLTCCRLRHRLTSNSSTRLQSFATVVTPPQQPPKPLQPRVITPEPKSTTPHQPNSTPSPPANNSNISTPASPTTSTAAASATKSSSTPATPQTAAEVEEERLSILARLHRALPRPPPPESGEQFTTLSGGGWKKKETWTPERKRYLQIITFTWPALLLCGYLLWKRNFGSEEEKRKWEHTQALAKEIRENKDNIKGRFYVPSSAELPGATNTPQTPQTTKAAAAPTK